MQQKLDVVRDDRIENGGNQLIVVIGTPEQPLPLPHIDVQALADSAVRRSRRGHVPGAQADGLLGRRVPWG